MASEPLFCTTILLGDDPSETDAFRHEAIARAIGIMILTEDGGRAIALEGTWGSGKSTVISLLSSFLHSPKQLPHELIAAKLPYVKVITFDAWAHQGDPLRRTFLEHTITELKPWLRDEEKWSRKLDELAKRLTTSTTKSRPELTFLGAVGALALLLSPIGYQLFGTLTKDPKKDISYWAYGWLTVGAFPIIVAVIISLRWLISISKHKREAFPSLIYSSTENRITTTSYKTPDPTTIEFEAAYSDLLTDAIGEEPRKLVIVVDNLDRLDDAEAKAIWATLRTFFDAPLRRHLWYKKVWVIVPFDEGRVAGVWKTNDDDSTSEPPSEHFIAKTFQAIFRVPPPLVTAWENFFFLQLSRAFPNHSDQQESRSLFRIYDVLRPHRESQPTPRQIITFVNELGSLHRQWQHEIPLSTQAAFCLVLRRKQEGDFLDRLRTSNTVDFIPNGIVGRLEGDWQKDMAALYFNVSAEVAFQTLLEAPLLEALRKDDSQTLLKLEESPGFAEVLEAIFEDRYDNKATIDSEELANTVLSLSRLEQARSEYKFCKTTLYQRVIALQFWKVVNAKTGEALVALAGMDSQFDLEALLRGLLASLKVSLSVGIDSKHLIGWCQAIDVVVPSFAALNEFMVKSTFRIPGGSADYISVLTQLASLKSASLRYASPTNTKEEIIDAFIEMASSGSWTSGLASVVLALLHDQQDWNWDPLISAFTRTLGKHQLDVEVTVLMCSTLNMLLRKVRLKEASIAFDGVDTDLGMVAFDDLRKADRTPEAATLAVLLIASGANTNLVPPPAPIRNYNYVQHNVPLSAIEQSANSAKSVIRALIDTDEKSVFSRTVEELALDFFDLTQWYDIADSHDDRVTFVSRLVNRAFHSGLIGDSLPASTVLIAPEFWQSALGDESFSALLTEMLRTNQLQTALDELDYDAKFDEIYLLVKTHGGHEVIARKVLPALRAASLVEWTEALSTNGPRLSLVAVLPELGLGVPFEKPLFDLASSSFERNQAGTFKDYVALVNALSEDDQHLFYSQLTDGFIIGSGAFDVALKSWGDVLTQGLLREGPERALARYKQLLETARPTELNWLKMLLESWGTKPPKAPSLRKALKTELRRLLADQSLSTAQHAALYSFGGHFSWLK